MRIFVAFAMLIISFVAGGQEQAALAPKLLSAHELQMPVEQEALQRQFDTLSSMQLPKLEYSVSGPVAYLQGDTGIVLPESVRALKKGDSAAEVFALFKDILLAKGTEVVEVQKLADPTDAPFTLQLSHSIRGIPVYEGTIAVKYDPATLRVSAIIAGHFVPDRGLPRTPRLSASEAEQIVAELVRSQDGIAVEMLAGTHLAYYIGWRTYPAQRPDGSRPPYVGPLSPHLAWVVAPARPWDELCLVDALTGEIILTRTGRSTMN